MIPEDTANEQQIQGKTCTLSIFQNIVLSHSYLNSDEMFNIFHKDLSLFKAQEKTVLLIKELMWG